MFVFLLPGSAGNPKDLNWCVFNANYCIFCIHINGFQHFVIYLKKVGVEGSRLPQIKLVEKSGQKKVKKNP